MTTLPNRPNTALLIVDVQKGVVEGALRRDEVIANINALLGKARAEEVPVVWVQHSDDGLKYGSEIWEYVPELVREDSEPWSTSSTATPSRHTDLESLLADRGVGRLVVTGAQTDACIRSTMHGAFTRGYDVTLVSDAHTTEDLSAYGAPPVDQVIAHTNLYWNFQSAPGREASVVEAADVTFGPGRGEVIDRGEVIAGARDEAIITLHAGPSADQASRVRFRHPVPKRNY